MIDCSITLFYLIFSHIFSYFKGKMDELRARRAAEEKERTSRAREKAEVGLVLSLCA